MMRSSTASAIHINVRPKDLKDRPKLSEALERLAKSDPSVEVTITGDDLTISGPTELHLRSCIKILEKDDPGVSLTIGSPSASFRESVLAEMEEKFVIAISENKHNRIYVRADPVDEKLSEAIGAGLFDGKDAKGIADILKKDYGTDQRVLAFSKHNSNILVDNTTSAQY
ncbi:hypothetical protein ABW20_dc0109939 [Dactylellina cionopaga]|nr:hypothetical protein ABW20_dc0109939 [Dactylellina cionopaga]